VERRRSSRLSDTTINAAEARDGIVITGTAEAGSTVTSMAWRRWCRDGTYTATIPASTLRRRMARLLSNVATTMRRATLPLRPRT
jgi:hypothetical protein